MPLKLNSSGGGSVTLDVPSTASDFTATVPANSGTLVTTGSTAAVTPAMLSTGAPNWDSSGNLSFNSGYGSVATAFGCRAWVNFNGTGTVAIRASGNVSSITDAGVGDYIINLSSAMPDANYAAVGSYQYDSGAPPNVIFFDQSIMVYPQLTNQIYVYTGYVNSGGSGRTDVLKCCVAVFR